MLKDEPRRLFADPIDRPHQRTWRFFLLQEPFNGLLGDLARINLFLRGKRSVCLSEDCARIGA